MHRDPLLPRVRGDPRFTDVIGEGEFPEVGLYSQYIPAVRKLLAEKGILLKPMNETLVALQA
eukprot:5102039-Heterocapsa_arctica.AAC.1